MISERIHEMIYMDIGEKIQNIKKPKIADTIGLLPDGEAASVDEFFENFVKPRLPKKEVVIQWHNILMEYIDDTKELSCAVRYGNSGSKDESLSGETGYLKLRRGWLTKNTDDNFEYFYADNYMSSFICKMAIDGYCPSSVDELRNIFQSHEFPFGYNFHRDTEFEAECVVIAIGDDPGFLGNYKISHVFDSGKNYDVKGKRFPGIKELSEEYFDIGYREQWTHENDHIRKIKIGEEEKEVITACFLRFVHPINYFLTPSTKKHICVPAVYRNDIGEYSLLKDKVIQYIKEQYLEVYDEFVEKIMWYDEPNEPCSDVKIEFGDHVRTMSLEKRLRLYNITLDTSIDTLNEYIHRFKENDDAYFTLICIYDNYSEKEINFWKNANTKHDNKTIDKLGNMIKEKVKASDEYDNVDEVKVKVLLHEKE